jgi:MoaA/NifB/PqqE/SkfB family radical SAM enzyme
VKQHNSPPFNLKEFKIEVTYRCDLNCIHCSSDARPSNLIEMSILDCLRILSEASSMGTKEVAFSGGEPLLWIHIIKAVEAAVNHQMNVTVYTSGNTEDFKKKAVKLYGSGASRFIFSIFGGTAVTHERITRKSGSFDQTKNAIGEALATGLKPELHFVPMSANYRELTDVVVLAKKIGASRVSVLRLVPQGRAMLIRNRVLNRVQNFELRRIIQDLRNEYGHNFIRTGSPYNFLFLN